MPHRGPVPDRPEPLTPLAHRTFTDAHGTEWQVWNVNPHVLEDDRRSGDDRRTPPPGERDPERRTEERRGQEERRTRPRLVVSQELEDGWLTFESAAGKRRLIPIPPGWQALGDAELNGLLEQAVPVRARGS